MESYCTCPEFTDNMEPTKGSAIAREGAESKDAAAAMADNLSVFLDGEFFICHTQPPYFTNGFESWSRL